MQLTREDRHQNNDSDTISQDGEKVQSQIWVYLKKKKQPAYPFVDES